MEQPDADGISPDADDDPGPDYVSDAEWDASLAELKPEIAATLRKWAAEEDGAKRERARRKRLEELVRPRARRRSRLDAFSDVAAAPPVSVRLPRWLDEQVRREFEESRVNASEGLRQIVEEWWVGRRFPALEYREAEFLRLPSVRGGPSIVDWIAAPDRYHFDPQAEEQARDYAMLARVRVEAELRRPG